MPAPTAVQARASSAVHWADCDTVTDKVWWASCALMCFVDIFMIAASLTRQAIDEDHESNMGMRVAYGLMAVSCWSLFAGLCLLLVTALIAGVAAVLLMVCAGWKWQEFEDYFFSAPAMEKPGALARLGLFVGAFLLGLFPVGCVLAMFISIYLTVVYCAQEALGKGDEHVKGMYVFYALCALGCVLSGLVLASFVVATVALYSEGCAGAMWRPGSVADRARKFFFSLGGPLEYSMGGASLAALVVLAGTGAYVVFS